LYLLVKILFKHSRTGRIDSETILRAGFCIVLLPLNASRERTPSDGIAKRGNRTGAKVAIFLQLL